jgi:hypothetical protein
LTKILEKKRTVTTHFEKITHFENLFQSALKFEQPQRTLNIFFQSALNLGLHQRGLIFFFKMR